MATGVGMPYTSVTDRQRTSKESTVDTTSSEQRLPQQQQQQQTEQQQHERCLFENDRVRVSDLRLPPGCIATCTARYPTIRWQVDAGKHALVVQGEDGAETEQTEVVEDVADKQVFFVEAGLAWRLKNICSGTYRQILFEIKQPPKYSEEKVRELLAKALYSPNVGTGLLFENRLCRVWDFFLQPGEGGPITDSPEYTHHHVMDYVFVYVAKGRLLGYDVEGQPLFDSKMDDGDVIWTDIPESAAEDPAYAHGGKNGFDDKVMREYLVELK
eukprot:TRINITY_DN1821_c0_g1_i1.p1 TRINITY_DN1821_c0_g1~~TRINITY_DN1821_c0_g1_i1.p1  ORF type:complete len:295 (+),score=61.27 TRINITY_DN1821_c0_g1_i1:73-885(+)